METVMKHTGSCADDMHIHYEIDEENRLVTITADFIDTNLLTNFIIEIIGDKHGIEVIADDNDLNFEPDETQQPKKMGSELHAGSGSDKKRKYVQNRIFVGWAKIRCEGSHVDLRRDHAGPSSDWLIMKLHVLSDLHLEFFPFFPVETDADIVVLAGDIAKSDQGIYWARRMFSNKPIIFVPGNHEYYGSQRLVVAAMMRIAANANDVYLLNNDEIIIDGVRFLGSTLWTDFRLYSNNEHDVKLAMMRAQSDITDFRVIHEGLDGHFSPMHSVALHKNSVDWLKGKLSEPFDGKTVVVTHHLPCELPIDEYFKSPLSPAFASNLTYLFSQVDLWIHGHSHSSVDFTFSDVGTRVICNPRGYINEKSTGNENFEPGLIIEI